MIEKTPKYKQISTEAINLLQDGKYSDLLSKINDEYYYWDKVKYLAPKDVDKEVLWQAVKFQRNMSMQVVRFGNYSFRFSLSSKMQQLLHEFDLNIGGNLGSYGTISSRERNSYLISSIMEEAIASSQMEGASTTRKIAKDMLRKEMKPQNRSQQMIVNNYNTIRDLVETKGETFSISRLLEIHKSISEKTLDDSDFEGRFRTDNNIYVVNGITGDVAHTPPDFQEIESLMKDMCDFANNNTDTFIHPIVKGIILHFVLAWTHPFVDGNGRTARSIFYWYMLKNGYWLTEFLSISRIIYKSKSKYEKAYVYCENDDMDLTYFINYNLDAMRMAYNELRQYLSRKIDERNQRLISDSNNLNIRQRHILEILRTNPNSVFTTNEISNRFGVTVKTARADLQGLVELGYLKAVNLNTRKIGYVGK